MAIVGVIRITVSWFKTSSQNNGNYDSQLRSNFFQENNENLARERREGLAELQ
jgi:hypothetical protein